MNQNRRSHVEYRRRRLLRDEATAETAPANSTRQAPSGGCGMYAAAAQPANQPRVTDLIPVGWLSVAGSWMLALIVLSAVMVLQRVAPDATWQTGAPARQASADLATWCISTCLLVAAVYALLIFSLRRHRVDDYRGRYRLWVWSAAACVVASMECTARLSAVVTDLAGRWVEVPTWAQGPEAAAIVCGFCLLLLGTRLFLEMRGCLAARLLIVGAAVGWLSIGLAMHLDLTTSRADLDWIVPCGQLGSILLLLQSFVLFARHCYREVCLTAESARGSVKTRAVGRRPRLGIRLLGWISRRREGHRKGTTASDSAAGSLAAGSTGGEAGGSTAPRAVQTASAAARTIDARQVPSSPSRTETAGDASQAESAEIDAADSGAEGPHTSAALARSKAERRRLRRQQRRQKIA